MPLSDSSVRSAKPREKPYKLADSGGLYLFSQPNGSKLWRLKYRFAEKEKTLSFGSYPLVLIADARQKRDDAKRQLLTGNDPSMQKKLDRIAAATAARTTFGLIAEEYIGRMNANDAAEATIVKTTWLLEDLAKPLSKRPIKEIAPAAILDLLRRIAKSGRRETARRLRGTIGAVFRLAVVTFRADSDPTTVLHGALQPPKATARPAITNEREFGKLLTVIDEYDGWPTIKGALQFLAVACVRPGEVRHATRTEFDLNKGDLAHPC